MIVPLTLLPLIEVLDAPTREIKEDAQTASADELK
jgi:hypothetical protein